MTTAGLHPFAEAVERQLGDPRQVANPFGFAAAVRRDEAEEFPTQFRDALVATGLMLAHVPAASGGTLVGFDQSLMAIRTAARRDPSIMPALMLDITATACVLITGSDTQRREVIAALGLGRRLAFALSEPDHGSDLLANECRLDRHDSGWTLTGTKWLVGVGARAELIYLVARTGQRGPAAFTGLLLDRSQLRSDRMTVGVGARTVGMRGIDFVDYHFAACPVPEQAQVGMIGQGLEASMKAMQVVRVMSAAANLACADTALRVAVDFATQHRVAGTPVIASPYVRDRLGRCWGAVIATDAVALTAARGLHVVPRVFSLWSGVVKRIATEASQQVMTDCADVLGSRGVLREGPWAIYQKVRRDETVVRHIDTSPLANLRLVAAQLPSPRSVEAGISAADAEKLRAIFDLGAALPDYDPTGLDLAIRDRDVVTAGLASSVAVVRARLVAAGGDDAAEALHWIAVLEDALDGTVRSAADLRRELGSGYASSLQLTELAGRFCDLHAASVCVHLWRFSAHLALFGEPPNSARWLACGLGYLLEGVATAPRTPGDVARGVVGLLRLHEQGRAFSAVPVLLAESFASLSPPAPIEPALEVGRVHRDTSTGALT